MDLNPRHHEPARRCRQRKHRATAHRGGDVVRMPFELGTQREERVIGKLKPTEGAGGRGPGYHCRGRASEAPAHRDVGRRLHDDGRGLDVPRSARVREAPVHKVLVSRSLYGGQRPSTFEPDRRPVRRAPHQELDPPAHGHAQAVEPRSEVRARARDPHCDRAAHEPSGKEKGPGGDAAQGVRSRWPPKLGGARNHRQAADFRR